MPCHWFARARDWHHRSIKSQAVLQDCRCLPCFQISSSDGVSSLSGHPVLIFDHLHGNRVFPYVSSEFLRFQLMSIVVFSCHHTSSGLAPSFLLLPIREL